jgi:hypothetical protein
LDQFFCGGGLFVGNEELWLDNDQEEYGWKKEKRLKEMSRTRNMIKWNRAPKWKVKMPNSWSGHRTANNEPA